MGRQMKQLPLLAAALPAALVGLVSVAQIGLSLFGANPVWAVESVTMAEAAALRDPAMLARMIQQGRDPYVPGSVREGLLVDDAVTLTPLDAAIVARRGEMVALVVWMAPPRDTREWVHALCVAGLVGDEDTSATLARLKPASVEADCAGFTPLW